jgi:hypothetical protein
MYEFHRSSLLRLCCARGEHDTSLSTPTSLSVYPPLSQHSSHAWELTRGAVHRIAVWIAMLVTRSLCAASLAAPHHLIRSAKMSSFSLRKRFAHMRNKHMDEGALRNVLLEIQGVTKPMAAVNKQINVSLRCVCTRGVSVFPSAACSLFEASPALSHANYTLFSKPNLWKHALSSGCVQSEQPHMCTKRSVWLVPTDKHTTPILFHAGHSQTFKKRSVPY